MKKILVTGGTGMVGRELQKILPGIYLSSRYRNDWHYPYEWCDLTDTEQVMELFSTVQPDVVIHLAGKVGGIVDNMNHQADYFDENLVMNYNVVKACNTLGISRFIGMLSTCIYPDNVEKYPLHETDIHLGPPALSNKGYAYAKRAMAVQVDLYRQMYEKKYSCLIPCNLYGPFDKFDEKRSHYVSALIRKIALAKKSGADHITLMGDGTPCRQFMYAADLAHAIKLCVDYDVFETMNVVPDEEYTVKGIAQIALEACDAGDLKIIWDNLMPNGQWRKTASNWLFRKHFPNFTFTSLREGIHKTYSQLPRSVI